MSPVSARLEGRRPRCLVPGVSGVVSWLHRRPGPTGQPLVSQVWVLEIRGASEFDHLISCFSKPGWGLWFATSSLDVGTPGTKLLVSNHGPGSRCSHQSSVLVW